MAESQRELLDRLRINRDEEYEDTGGGKRWLIVGFVTFCALVAAIAIYSFWPAAEEPQTASTDTPASTTLEARSSVVRRSGKKGTARAARVV